MQFHHVGYLVRDISRSMDAFQLLGYKVERPSRLDEVRLAYIGFMRMDGSRIEIIQPANDESPIYLLMKKYKNTPYHLCFSTTNMDEDIKMLEAKGFMVFKARETAPCMDHKDVVFLMSQDIGMIELYENDGDW